MVNLLFISSNPKIDAVKTALQPSLRVKIDTVGDFDIGLKDVFEKRPAVVFIQDHIAGVTGESVARHIQMLLGSSAPSFIFMHDGNLKSKPVKGLYEHVIDLSQSPPKIFVDIQSNLASLLGAQWQKIYIPREQGKPAAREAVVVPEEHRAVADQLVDDFIADLDDVANATVCQEPFPDFSLPDSPGEDPFQIMSSTHDQLDEIRASAASELKLSKAAAEASAGLSPDVAAVGSEGLSAAAGNNAATVPFVPEPAAEVKKVSRETTQPNVTVPAPGTPPKAPASPVKPENATVPPISPADFRIKRDNPPATVSGLDINTSTVARNKPGYSGLLKGVIVVLILAITGIIWFKQKSGQLQSEQGKKNSPPAIVAAPAVQQQAPAPKGAEGISSAVAPQTAKDPMPSFIPVAGHDSAFSAAKPGWERYVGADAEFRVFRSGGKLKAVQVLALTGGRISEVRLKSVLRELAGTDSYRIASLEKKHGFQVSRATIHRKADLLIYRKANAIHAFVVSLDS